MQLEVQGPDVARESSIHKVVVLNFKKQHMLHFPEFFPAGQKKSCIKIHFFRILDNSSYTLKTHFIPSSYH